MAKPVNIAGLTDLERKLALLPRVVTSDLDQSIAMGAGEIAALQKRVAPVQFGELRDSIRVIDNSQPGRPGVKIVAAGGDAFYGLFQEFGWEGNPGSPFFFGPYRALRRRVRARNSRTLRRSLDKVARS